jgi:hypothetical protein
MHMPCSTTRSIRTIGAHPWASGQSRLVFAAVCLLLCACHKAPPDVAGSPAAGSPAAGSPAAEAPSEAAKAEEGVTLTAEQIEKLGILTQPAQSIDYSDETTGYGVVVSHDVIAQAVAELATAQANAQLSRAALARARRLAGTPGAVSADVEEAAAQKAAVDAAALTLTIQRMSTIVGMNPPWKNGNRGAFLHNVADGRIKMVRVTFPLGALGGGIPTSLRATHIGASKPGADWKMNTVWDAPADPSVPGRSFFSMLKGSDAVEGERLQVWAPIGTSVSGVALPAEAAVMSDGKYWCYVEKKPGTFVRIQIDTDKPTADGYFVNEGIRAGDKVVTTAAGQLLAKETGSAAEPE